MFYFRHRLLVWWITLVVVLAGSLMHSAQATFAGAGDESSTTITMEICGPKGERLTYDITFDDVSDDTLHHAAHCIFCILPGSVDTAIDSAPFVGISEFTPLTKISFSPYVYVPSEHDRWYPHRALAPPYFSI